MSTVTVSNIQTANATIPLTITTGNTTAGALIVDNSSVFFRPNTTVNATINSTSIYLNGVPIIDASTVPGSVVLSGNVTPANLTDNTAAWNPDPSDNSFLIRSQASSTNATILSYTVYGLSPGVNGQIYTISNIGPVRINFNTEDSANETTAANRFNFPNHIALDGYMSMEIYYDGTLSRWRMVDSINIPFDHKYSLTKGFFLGGESSPLLRNTADRNTYSTETTASVAGAVLSQSRSQFRSSGNADKGFSYCGVLALPSTFSAVVDRTTFSTEATAAVTGAALPVARFLHNCIGNADKGLIAGGLTPSSPTNPGPGTTDRTTFSTETTAAVSGGNISQARQQFGGVSNADKGFFAGGYTTTLVATTDRTTFSTETNVAVSGANLSQARQEPNGVGDQDKGFFAGGVSSLSSPFPRAATADRVTYATETTAAVSGANLSQSRASALAAGTKDKGFFAGGNLTPGPTSVSAVADRTTYSTETTAAVTGANLSQARCHGGAF